MVVWLTKSQVVKLLKGRRPEEMWLETNEFFYWGSGQEAYIYFDGTDWLFVSISGQLVLDPDVAIVCVKDLFMNSGTTISIRDPTNTLSVDMYHDGSHFYIVGSPGSGNFYFEPAGDSIFADIQTADIRVLETGTATAAVTGYDSNMIYFRGSGWDGATAQLVTFRVFNDVTNATNYSLIFERTYPSIYTVFALTQAGDLSIPGDISAAGGYKSVFNFQQIDVAAGQTNVPIDVLGLPGNTEYVLPYAGSIIALSIASNAARTGGTLVVTPTINGTLCTIDIDLSAVTPQYNYTAQLKDIDTFSGGDRLGVKITTDAAWAPTTADIVVTVVVEF